MKVSCVNIAYLLIGAVLGFGGTMIVEFVKRSWTKSDQKERNKYILQGLEKEIERLK